MEPDHRSGDLAERRIAHRARELKELEDRTELHRGHEEGGQERALGVGVGEVGRPSSGATAASVTRRSEPEHAPERGGGNEDASRDADGWNLAGLNREVGS